ncbi:hypothetical protein M9M90_06975 [Phenylobacterium sp. LH3H17]|uniref:hypothetical protein n=1 Tax=Phenylobacterium sp. LH3H17 TaxID=2903901 RepID=UPI0020C98ADE|nr:hypothetical protein [Phenylobacterium sp. LH3H17]UTP40918.1 hypothetical protein M9M90_06975 [Phenylobacterium sp. LH3H17]
MTPTELRKSNIELFRALLERTCDPSERLRIERLRDEERLKPDDAYPLSTDKRSPRPPVVGN